MKSGEEIKHFHAYIKEKYIAKGKGHLSHQDLYSVTIKGKI
jgi:hypothetical protein